MCSSPCFQRYSRFECYFCVQCLSFFPCCDAVGKTLCSSTLAGFVDSFRDLVEPTVIVDK